MERETTKTRLAQAEEHVALGQRHIVRQHEIIAEMERDGHAAVAASARELLAHFEAAQALHIADRDRLRAELDKSR